MDLKVQKISGEVGDLNVTMKNIESMIGKLVAAKTI